jgi:class 3 adenylate cyclase
MSWQRFMHLVASLEPELGRGRRRRPGIMLSAATAAGMVLLSVTAMQSFSQGWWAHFIEMCVVLLLLTGVFGAISLGRFVFANVYVNVLVSLHLFLESLMFGPDVRTHDYFVVMAVATLLFFPRGARRTMVFTMLVIFSLWCSTLALLDFVAPVYHPSPDEVRALRTTNVVGLNFLLVTTAFFFRRHYTSAEVALEEEQERADRLLLDILPHPIVEQLKNSPTSIAQAHHDVTILFADIVGFTELSASLAPADVVRLLNQVFSAFDAVARKHGLEKIKTIGDAYMAAAGVPLPRADHAAAAASMALEILALTRSMKTPDGQPLRLRIGINSGPVVAGVIGTTKFIYDLWGDAVNTASRMESHGSPGTIQVTASTRAALGDAFIVEERGVVNVKGKGPMTTWMIRGARSAETRATT